MGAFLTKAPMLVYLEYAYEELLVQRKLYFVVPGVVR